MRKFAHCIATVLVTLLAGAALAADLVIGRATEQSSLDPLFARSGTNYSTSGQIFERLVMNDANNQLHPALAVSWRAIDPTTWEIKLRDKVKFHDGSDFTADDVVFSFERARNVPNSPASFAGSVASIVNMRALDRLTVQLKTSQPVPSLIEQVGRAFILSKKAASGLPASRLKNQTPGFSSRVTYVRTFNSGKRDVPGIGGRPRNWSREIRKGVTATHAAPSRRSSESPEGIFDAIAAGSTRQCAKRRSSHR